MNDHEGRIQIFVRFITVKGRRLDARAYGHKAWPIWVKDDSRQMSLFSCLFRGDITPLFLNIL